MRTIVGGKTVGGTQKVKGRRLLGRTWQNSMLAVSHLPSIVVSGGGNRH
jgi:hypothetical protein